MTTDKTKAHGIRLPVDFSLSPEQIKVLVLEGAELFARLDMTPNAQKYLNEHPKLKEAIDKW